MMASTRAVLLELGVPEDKIKMEAFAASGMADAISPHPVDGASRSKVPTHGSTALRAGPIPTVHFRRSRKSADLPAQLTILEVAEGVGVEIPFECRAGICGQCKTRLLDGRVIMDVEDALAPGDKANGIILACQAHSDDDVAVDA
jgi:ferredoxin